MKQESL